MTGVPVPDELTGVALMYGIDSLRSQAVCVIGPGRPETREEYLHIYDVSDMRVVSNLAGTGLAVSLATAGAITRATAYRASLATKALSGTLTAVEAALYALPVASVLNVLVWGP